MKRLSVFAFTMLLACSLSFAQTGGGSGKPVEKGPPAADTGKKPGKEEKGGKKGHKGGKKGKKSSGGQTTPPPK